MPDDRATIVWFRRDLRIADHAALLAAAQRGRVVPLFIWSLADEQPWVPGGAAKVWLAGTLRKLGSELASLGSRLILRSGPYRAMLEEIVKETGASRVYWSRRYEPRAAARDEQIAQALRKGGIESRQFSGALLFEPDEIRNLSGLPFQVFTPFSKACLARSEPNEPLPAPKRLSSVDPQLASLSLDDLEFAPPLDWPAGIGAAWQPESEEANERLKRFLGRGIVDYGDARNHPEIEGTSRLSPYLHWGEISPRQIWHAVEDLRGLLPRQGDPKDSPSGPEVFLREILWREFAHHLLVHFPHTDLEPLRTEFKSFPWRDNVKRLRAWQRGQTGYPLVDAGMRQLWQTGWMHNRVRMVVASFLVKDLLIPWQRGAEWFWDKLVDADLANNSLGWQWTAGCGADAAPFFRIFNPVSQGKQFDPDGNYVRRWVPELSALPTKWIHAPWDAPPEVLSTVGVRLGETYPTPIVDHAAARTKALAAFSAMNEKRLPQSKGAKKHSRRT